MSSLSRKFVLVSLLPGVPLPLGKIERRARAGEGHNCKATGPPTCRESIRDDNSRPVQEIFNAK